MLLKKCHLAILMASGMMGTLHLTSDDGYPMLVKGRVVKVVDKVVHRDPEDPETIVERYRDRYVTTVATLSQHGLDLIQDVDALTRLMHQYGDKIAAHTLETYKPLYDLKPTEAELAVMDSLGKPKPGCYPRRNTLPSAITARPISRGRWGWARQPSPWG
jgi:hypothetical protein